MFFFKQKTAYEMRISDWSSDVCSSDLLADIEKFRSLYRAHPPTHFFFIPQYQGDLESLARQTSESLSQSVATFDDMVSGRLAERTRAEARKAYEEAMRNR